MDLTSRFKIDIILDDTFYTYYRLIDKEEILLLVDFNEKYVDICATDETKTNLFHIRLLIKILENEDNINYSTFTIGLTDIPEVKTLTLTKNASKTIIQYNYTDSITYECLCENSYINEWNGEGKVLYNYNISMKEDEMSTLINKIVTKEDSEYLHFNVINKKTLIISITDEDDNELDNIVPKSNLNTLKKTTDSISNIIYSETLVDMYNIKHKPDMYNIYLSKECPIIMEYVYNKNKINVAIP